MLGSASRCNARFKLGPKIRFRGWAGWPIGGAAARPSGISPGGGRWVFLVTWMPGSDLEPNGPLLEMLNCPNIPGG